MKQIWEIYPNLVCLIRRTLMADSCVLPACSWQKNCGSLRHYGQVIGMPWHWSDDWFPSQFTLPRQGPVLWRLGSMHANTVRTKINAVSDTRPILDATPYKWWTTDDGRVLSHAAALVSTANSSFLCSLLVHASLMHPKPGTYANKCSFRHTSHIESHFKQMHAKYESLMNTTRQLTNLLSYPPLSPPFRRLVLVQTGLIHSKHRTYAMSDAGVMLDTYP